MKESYTLIFKWTVSRRRDTYGYNICSLYIDGEKVASCNGGGYDMKGTVLGIWMKFEFSNLIKGLKCNYGSGDETKGFYGLRFYDLNNKSINEYVEGGKFYLDGECGFESMVRILNAVGYEIRYVHGTKNESIYLIMEGDLCQK